MSTVMIPEKELASDLKIDVAVDQAYSCELAEVCSKIIRGLPVLIECDKDLAPYLFVNIRNRLRNPPHNLRCLYLDGRPRQQEGQQAMPQGLIQTMIGQLRDAVRGEATEKRVVVLPHLDLLTTNQGGLTAEAREVIPLLYENPDLVWLGFKDPSFSIPKVIENLFLHRISLIGLSRTRLRYLITQKESRKFGKTFNPWALYKHISGMNAARLRKLLATLEGEDYPEDPRQAFRQLRQATCTGGMEIPDINLEKDIGGYAKVKDRLNSDILGLLANKDKLTDPEEISKIEQLVPRGMIFHGPPGSGKTLFAKAVATAIGAAIQVVSGPELKSKWVGESEENLRRIFYQARQSAPSIIVFDELDSFATARGTYTGSGVEHSMVNQLLTEMDGFRKEELVFIVGTTNFVESIDPALLRPGRFEFHLHIPYPDDDARREIIKIYDKKMKLHMTDECVERAVERTDFTVPGAAADSRFSGDHLNALCRSIARKRMRDNTTNEPTTPKDVEDALTQWIDRQELKAPKDHIVAVHEAGHAILAMEFNRPIKRIALTDDVIGALGYVMHSDSKDFHQVFPKKQLEEDICILLGGRAAEKLLLKDVHEGAGNDIERATHYARVIVEVLGQSDDPTIGQMNYQDGKGNRRKDLSQVQLEALDKCVLKIINEQTERANKILAEKKDLVVGLSDLLVKERTIEAKLLGDFSPAAKKINDEFESKKKPKKAKDASPVAAK